MTTRRRVFVPILLVVFGVEVVIRIVLRTWLPLSVLAEASVGALALTIVSGPLLWLIVVKRIALKAEAGKVRADARVASILAASIDGIITIDAAGTVTHFNAGAEKIFGYPASEIINRNISVLIPEHFHSAHEQHVDRFAAGAICSRAMGEILATEGRRKSGEQFQIGTSASSFRSISTRRTSSTSTGSPPVRFAHERWARSSPPKGDARAANSFWSTFPSRGWRLTAR